MARNTANTELSPQQQQALSLLLAGVSVTQAAEEVGVARGTLSEWRHHDATFRAAFNAGMLSLADSHQQVLMDAHMKAMAKLVELLDDADKGVALKAAYSLLKVPSRFEYDKRTSPILLTSLW